MTLQLSGRGMDGRQVESRYGGAIWKHDRFVWQNEKASEASSVRGGDRGKCGPYKQYQAGAYSLIEPISVPSDGFQIYYLQSSLFVISKGCS